MRALQDVSGGGLRAIGMTVAASERDRKPVAPRLDSCLLAAGQTAPVSASEVGKVQAATQFFF